MHRCLHQHRVTLVPPSVFRGAVDAVHLPATAETLRPVAWVISTFFQLLLLARPVADLRPSPFPPPPISGSKVAARGTPVSLNVCARPVASRAQSLQVVAANKLSRPSLTYESIQMFKTGPNDSGSSSLQIALLTKRIESLTEHLLINKKDYACQRGLRILLGQRSRLTKYLQKKDYAEYERVMNGLGLRIKSA